MDEYRERLANHVDRDEGDCSLDSHHSLIASGTGIASSPGERVGRVSNSISSSLERGTILGEATGDAGAVPFVAVVVGGGGGIGATRAILAHFSIASRQGKKRHFSIAILGLALTKKVLTTTGYVALRTVALEGWPGGGAITPY